LLLALAALNVLSCFSIVIGCIALASLTCFCSLTLQRMISRTTNKKRRSKFVSFSLGSVATASSLTHPNSLNLLFCIVLNFTPQDDMNIPARAAGKTACWTRMVQPMEQTATCVTLMAQQMVIWE
jgi:hypothetical protein